MVSLLRLYCTLFGLALLRAHQSTLASMATKHSMEFCGILECEITRQRKVIQIHHVYIDCQIEAI